MENVNSKLIDQLDNLPLKPGVYLMKDKDDKIIYIGKAKSLRKRVKSYFANQDKSTKNIFLLKKLERVEHLLTKSEAEALLLEAMLIKKHKPRFNVRLKDDKAYPYIRCSIKDRFPRLYLERRVKDRDSLYFGPYTQGGAVRNIVDFLNHTFQIRDCSNQNFKNRKRPCLTHQMGFCQAPCVDLQDEKNYKKQFQRAIQFLKGRHAGLIKKLQVDMNKMSKALRFEEAQKIKDNLKAVEIISQSQSVVRDSEKDEDMIYVLDSEQGCLIQFLYLRQGKLIGDRYQFFYKRSLNPDQLLSFFNQYYDENMIPNQVSLYSKQNNLPLKLLEQVLQLRTEKPCSVVFSEDKKLISLSQTWAEKSLKTSLKKADEDKLIREEIQKKFHLKQSCKRIECYDISHWQGKEVRGAQVVFEDGKLKKEDYRLYKLPSGQLDDYASLSMVLKRRFSKLRLARPDLILIDGGRGQLQVCKKTLDDMGELIPIVGLAKDRFKDKISTGERFYLPRRKNPIVFPSHSPALNLLLSLRDEAHRFCITAHRKQRDKEFLKGDLDDIPGLGKKRKEMLLKRFKSIKAIEQASVEELSSLPSFPKTLAKKIKLILKNKDTSI